MMEFLDKIYSNDKLFAMVYIIGAILLLVFIIMLIVSLKKPKTKKLNSKILEDKAKVTKDEVKVEETTTTSLETEVKEEPVPESPKIDKEEVKEEVVEENKVEVSNIETNTNVDNNTSVEQNNQTTESENTISKALENIENKDVDDEVNKEEVKVSLSSDIPDVDEYVDKVVKKTYEKNEQFSSVFVGNNTSTIKLDKVLEDLNVDDDIKVDIVPDDEKTEIKDEPIIPVVQEEENLLPEVEDKKDDIPQIDPDILEDRVSNKEEIDLKDEEKGNALNSLEDLKKAMEDKKKEVSSKQDELKAKLDGLKIEKKDDVMKAEDLLNKLNSMKSE